MNIYKKYLQKYLFIYIIINKKVKKRTELLKIRKIINCLTLLKKLIIYVKLKQNNIHICRVTRHNGYLITFSIKLLVAVFCFTFY